VSLTGIEPARSWHRFGPEHVLEAAPESAAAPYEAASSLRGKVGICLSRVGRQYSRGSERAGHEERRVIRRSCATPTLKLKRASAGAQRTGKDLPRSARYGRVLPQSFRNCGPVI